ncbi:hypothetical protein GGI20_003019 [Coemansia sp. BCRC 34301]|nr:hypothetical protein GGI20_003019 [Coemansia sp. BCRC 34301]
MFAVLFLAILLELLASMGTFGALVAQNLYTNSAAGWYVRLDWTAVYTYAVSILSVIITFGMAIGALTRGATGSKRQCSVLFNPFGLFIFGFIFSVLYVVIAGFAYRNPLPMKYPCDIFRHLRGSLEMLGLVSGRSLIEEGGLLVGICQSSKAFLVLAGISLGLWILIFLSSCAAMVTGLDPPKKGSSTHGSHRSLKSVLTSISRQKSSARPPPLSASYVEAGNVYGEMSRLPHLPLAAPQVCYSAQKRTNHNEVTGAYTAVPAGGAKYYGHNGQGDVTRQYPSHNNTASRNPHRCTSRCVVYTAKQNVPQAGKTSQTHVAIRSPHAGHPRPVQNTREDEVKGAVIANLASAFNPEDHTARSLPKNNEVSAAGQRNKDRRCCSQHRQQIDDDDISYKEASIHEHASRSIHSSASRDPMAPYDHEQVDHNNGGDYNDEYILNNADNQHFVHHDYEGSQMSPASQSSRRQRLRQLLSRVAD